MDRSGYERRNRKVFRHCLKTVSDGAEVMLGDSSFHTSAAETWKACLPTAVRENDGTIYRLFQEADLKLQWTKYKKVQQS